MKKKLVVASKFRTRFPYYDALVMDLIPYTNTSGWSHGIPSNNKYFWLNDIEDMVKELRNYEKDIMMHKQGAKQAMDDFTTSRIQFVVKNAHTARKYYDWASETAGKLQKEKKEMKIQRYYAIKERLRELGHVEKDIEYIKTMSAVAKDAELTDRSWSRIRTAVEAEVNKWKGERIARERKPLIESRKTVIKQVYSEYRKALVPTQWAYHPDISQVYTFEDFAALINDPSDSTLTRQHCHEALQSLPSYVKTFNEKKMATLLSLVCQKDDSSSGNNGDDILNLGRTRLDLATSVFQCSSYACNNQGPLIAWQSPIYHTCAGYFHGYSRCEDLMPVFKFNDRGSKAVEALAVLLGLDAHTATPTDYDRIDARFVCLNCKVLTRSGIHGRETFAWRDCVAHFVLERLVRDVDHTTPNWKLLAPEETRDIMRREKAQRDPAENEKAWSCNHCANNFDNFAQHEHVISHLRMMHGKASPVDGVDFFYDQRRRRLSRLPIMFGDVISQGKKRDSQGKKGDSQACKKQNYRCRLCRDNRQFILEGVQMHLKAKHNVTDPTIGSHIEQISG